ncbi:MULTISPECIES: PH domain-containing protein [unclassified Microbacterium]|uniref:PH domain-containing protein n=1 Tax=unclassified Microbacterium TaxID=2609290 RepID=UPI000EA9922E|nr:MULTISPECIES: PH domain-containing protein [unclassified Microbacterium]MBT2485323.1 PH domain-containing protein [Microbacterium sp. ISL-108]RKN68131.1 PH domain-containing protein [Microbacterium sp. CGR2]
MTADPRPEAARTYRAASGPVSLIVSALLALFLLGDAVIRAGWGSMLLLAPWVLLVLWVVYEVAVASVVRTDAEGGTVQNMLRRTTFGWRRVRDIDLRWQLVFSFDDGTDLTCFGGPARARPVRKRGTQGEAPKAPSGLRDLTEIRDRWEAAPAAADAPIQRSWDLPALIALGVIVVWAVVAVLIVNGG